MRQRKLTLALLLLLPALVAHADSTITKTYTQRPLPEVLVDIDNAAPEIDIRFIYNKLEEYTVTCTLHDASPIEAIQQAVGFYPIRVVQKDETVIVEPVFETEQKLIGRIVDEQGRPLEFANVKLFSATDGAFITGGVTNAGGDFVIPCSMGSCVAKASYVGYETLVKALDFPANTTSMDAGTWVLHTDHKVMAEVVVENDIATTSAEKSTYYPTRRHKNAALDATSLLQHMMIPQLRVNPATGYVTTLSGERVAIFIDYIPATLDDLAGMNTQDVRHVDIYDFPKDVRFHNHAHVINFVMQQYEVGGYTKLSTVNQVMAAKDYNTSNSVYSKLVSKRWTFDANVSDVYATVGHLGAVSEAVYHLRPQSITRTEKTDYGISRMHKPSASIRATYTHDKMQLANRLEILYEGKPKRNMCGTVGYTPNVSSPTTYESRRSSGNLTSRYIGSWYFYLPKQWTLTFGPQFQYFHNTQSRYYKETTLIENDIKEDLTSFDWNLDIRKTLSARHSIKLTNYGLAYNSAIDYKGSTTSTNNQGVTAIAQGVEYRFSTEKFNFSTELVYAYQRNKLDNETEYRGYPVAMIEGSYSPDKRNSVSLFVNYNTSEAEDAQLNPSLMQESELMYYCGNPALKFYQTLYSQLQYTWMPNNKFTASAYVQDIYVHDYIANIYEPYNGGTAIIRRIGNVGNSHETSLGTSFTLRLLKGKLQLSAKPTLKFLQITGLYDVKATPFTFNVGANYYLGQFYFMAGYTTPKKTYDKDEVAWLHARSFYYLTAGWGNARWKARLDIVNPLRTDWRNKRTEIATPLYAANTQAFNASSHQRLTFTLAYTFNYGKKVKPGNELGTATSGQSSIL